MTETNPTTATMAERALPWVARGAWILAAVFGSSALEAAADDAATGVRWATAIGGWVVFAAVLIALLIPSVLSLTVSRVLAPLSVVATVIAAIAGASGSEVALLGVPALVAVAAIFTADIGRWMTQASAYGDEQRLPLRTPLAAGSATVVSWAVWAALTLGGVLTLASGNLLVGVPLVIVAVAVTVVLAPRWHRMSRRWLVLVPAGLVVHDPVVMADTVMVRTDQVAKVTLAPADTEAADLTGPASGYAIEVTTSETVTSVFAFTPKEPNGRAIHMTAFLVAPSRPGLALRLAQSRGLPVV